MTSVFFLQNNGDRVHRFRTLPAASVDTQRCSRDREELEAKRSTARFSADAAAQRHCHGICGNKGSHADVVDGVRFGFRLSWGDVHENDSARGQWIIARRGQPWTLTCWPWTLVLAAIFSSNFTERISVRTPRLAQQRVYPASGREQVEPKKNVKEKKNSWSRCGTSIVKILRGPLAVMS